MEKVMHGERSRTIIPPIIIVFGHPGSGKGTQAKRLIARHKFFDLETGERFRQEMRKGTRFGKLITPYMVSGRLVPADLVYRVVESLIVKHRDYIERHGGVFDGYPRNSTDARDFGKILRKAHLKNPVVVFYLATEDRELMKRMLLRGREDDTPKIIKKRFAEYHRVTAPALPYLRKKYYVIDIDGNPPIPEVGKSIEKALKPYLP